jgi:hypothetical protein
MWQNLQAQSARLVEDFDFLLQKDIVFVIFLLCVGYNVINSYSSL